MNQGRKEFILGILITLLLWLFGPEIIPSNIVTYVRPLGVAIIVLIAIWLLIGGRVIDWYNNTSKERKLQKIDSLKTELIRVEARQIYFMRNPDQFLRSVVRDFLQILVSLCFGFLVTSVSSIFEFFGPIPFSIVAIPIFLDAYVRARKAFRLYYNFYFFDLFKESIESQIQKLSATNDSSKNLQILSAYYIVQGTNIKMDVTEVLNNKVTDGKIDYIVGVDLVLFDPAPKFNKELSLSYVVRGEKKKLTILNGERLLLP